jgi:signal transduction histidine kinase
MWGLGKSVNHLESVITELGFLRRSLELQPVDADLNQVVDSALACLGGSTSLRLLKNLRPLPKLRFDPAQIRKVTINLLLNARDAVAGDGEIRMETGQSDGWAIFSVTDNGCGMTSDFVRKSLFKPFRTTKKKGLGIGLFHCKMIIEAHKGRINVETAKEKGTTFHVLLPLATETT